MINLLLVATFQFFSNVYLLKVESLYLQIIINILFVGIYTYWILNDENKSSKEEKNSNKYSCILFILLFIALGTIGYYWYQ